MRTRSLTLILALSLAAGGQAWQTDLAYSGAGLWRHRLPLVLTNRGAADLEGRATTVPIALPAGALADSLRICDDAGVEMLWDLRDAAGRHQPHGEIGPGATLTVPCTAPAGGTQRLWVYWSNPDAWRVPEFLHAGAEPANLSFETGDGEPAEWRFDGGDETHTLALSAGGRTGERCVRCEVAPGAEPTWIAARQLGRSIVPGAHYKLTGWARGENVVGTAGWYVHVATPAGDQTVSLLEKAGDGTFAWRQVAMEFDAPADATSLSYGTVLRGTGTAWFDDFAVEVTGATADTVEAALGAIETLDLGPPPRPVQGESSYLPVVVDNLEPGPRSALVAANLAGLLPALRGGGNTQLIGHDGRPVPIRLAGGRALFVAEVPGRTSASYAAVAADGPGPALDFADLLAGPLNRAGNADFEEGGPLPEAWPGGAEQPRADGVTMARVRGGRFGQWCTKVTVPAAAQADWVGWRQRVPVRAGERFIFSAWIKTEDVDGGVSLHGHFRTADGELAGRAPYWSCGRNVTGTSDWTELSGSVTIPPGCELFELHLTANCHGTFYHDGVLFAPVVEARVGELQGVPVDGLEVWAEDPLIKVFRGSPPREGDLRLFASRGETEALQLCLAGFEEATVSVSPLTGPGGALPAPRMYTVGYVPCFEPSGYFSSDARPWERRKPTSGGRTDGWRGWWPDPLLPLERPVDLAAGRTQPIWLMFDVPRDAAPGEYHATVTVKCEAETVERPLTLRVWRYQQPERPSLQVIYDLRNGPGPRAFSNQEQIEQWWRFMAERRISTDAVLPAPEFRLVDGRVTMDSTAFDRAATLCFDKLHMAAAYFPSVFYACGWAYPPRDFLGTTYPGPEYDAAYSEAVRLFRAHVTERGWADRLTLYVSDEPHVWNAERGTDVTAWLAHVIGLTRAVDPAIPVYSSTWEHVLAWDGILNHWGIGQYGNFPLDRLAERRAAGDKVWFTTDGQMEIDTPYCACERMLPYYCFAHDVSGYEFWGLSWWTFDPYQFGWHSYISQGSFPGDQGWVRYPNGDGYLAYPGEPLGLDGPVSSIRLEQARDGIEDYELLRALAAVQARQPDARIAALLEEVRALAFIPNAGGYRATDILPDPHKLIDLRRRAGELLDEVM